MLRAVRLCPRDLNVMGLSEVIRESKCLNRSMPAASQPISMGWRPSKPGSRIRRAVNRVRTRGRRCGGQSGDHRRTILHLGNAFFSLASCVGDLGVVAIECLQVGQPCEVLESRPHASAPL